MSLRAGILPLFGALYKKKKKSNGNCRVSYLNAHTLRTCVHRIPAHCPSASPGCWCPLCHPTLLPADTGYMVENGLLPYVDPLHPSLSSYTLLLLLDRWFIKKQTCHHSSHVKAGKDQHPQTPVIFLMLSFTPEASRHLRCFPLRCLLAFERKTVT